MKRKLTKDDYLYGAIVILIVAQIIIAIVQVRIKQPPWINVGCAIVQSCSFAICLKKHLKEKKEKRETFQKYIKEEYASQQILNQCQKCEHYQGQIHGGNLLVCAFHPYGQENCEDFE